MTAVEDQSARMSTPGWLDRMVWIVGGLLLITVVGFGVFYYRDRYVHPNESIPDRQVRLLEGMIRQNPADPNARVAVAKWYLENDLVDEAIEQGKEALALDEYHLDALILLGQAYQQQGDIEQAIANFARVVELNENNQFAMIDLRMNLVYYNLGELYRQRGEYDSAIEVLKNALRVDRTDADARYTLALLYQEKGDYRAAVQEFNEALRYVPEFPEVYRGLRVSYEALGMNAEAAYAEAMVAYTEANYERAAQQLEGVIQEAPDFDPAYLGLGMVYEKLGQREQAITAAQRYLEAHPDSLAARHVLGRLGVRSEDQ